MTDKEWAVDEWKDFLMGNFENGEATYNSVVNRVKFHDSRVKTRTGLVKRFQLDLKTHYFGMPPEYDTRPPHIKSETRKFRFAEWQELAIFCIEMALGE